MARVDYDKVARTYQAGRSEAAQIDRWAAAVAPYLPRRNAGLRVLDLGAGTGIFARAWSSWGASHVVALDPSRPMLDESRRVGLPGGVHPVVGRGEELPLRPGSVDLAWLSTVFHHLVDRDRCVAELRRVLADGGVVLVRGHFPDQEGPGWFGVFPGVGRATAGFPTLAAVTDVFQRGGFSRRGVERVPGGRAPASALSAWARAMRHADSLLGALTDEEMEAGLEALDRAGGARLDGVSLHLAAYAVDAPT